MGAVEGGVECWELGVASKERGDLWACCVLVAAGDPLVADGEAVGGQSVRVVLPELDAGVVSPALGEAVNGSQYLQNFDALFAESLAIKDSG